MKKEIFNVKKLHVFLFSLLAFSFIFSNPSHSQTNEDNLLSEIYSLVNNVNNVFLSEDYAYVTVEESSLVLIVDIHSSANPEIMGFYETLSIPQDVFISEGYLYTFDGYEKAMVGAAQKRIEEKSTINKLGILVSPGVPKIKITDTLEPMDDRKLPFEDIVIGNSSNIYIYIKNIGSADLTIGNIAQENPIEPPFIIEEEDNKCNNITLPPGKRCTFTVKFRPNEIGFFEKTFDIPSNDTNESSVTISLTGNGIKNIPNAPPTGLKLVYPSEGLTNLPANNLELIWKKAVDPQGTIVNYTLYYCDTSEVTKCSPVNVNSNPYSNGEVVYGTIFNSWVSLLFGFFIFTCTKIKKYTGSWLLMALFIAGGLTLSACNSSTSDTDNISSSARPVQPKPASDELSYKITGLHKGIKYYWKVVATDMDSNSSESKIWDFKVKSY